MKRVRIKQNKRDGNKVVKGAGGYYTYVDNKKVEIPFLRDTVGNKRSYLTEQQIKKHSYVKDFVSHYHDCFEHDLDKKCYWFFPMPPLSRFFPDD